MGPFNRRACNQIPYNAPSLTYEPPDSLRPDVRAFDPTIEDTRSIDPRIQDVRAITAPRFGVALNNYTVGDWWIIQRTFAVNSSKIQIVKVYWTVYHGLTDWVIGTVADGVNIGNSLELILQAVIRPVQNPASVSGVITDANPNDGTISFYGVLRHIYIRSGTPAPITARGTRDLLAGQEYPYDLQAVDANGSVYTLETGTILTQAPCTRQIITPPLIG